jgi:hypothetical protein
MVVICLLIWSLGCSSIDQGVPGGVNPVSNPDPYADYLTEDGVYVGFSQGIGEPALIRLLTEEGMRPLRTITVHGQPLTVRSAEAIMTADATAGLQTLYLQGSPIGDDGLKVLATSPRLSQIEHLNLQKVNATATGVAALAASPHLKAQSLSLGWQPVKDAGAMALAKATQVKSLHLESAEIGTMGMVSLLQESKVESITFIGNPAGLQGLSTISPSIQAVVIDDCGLTTKDIQTLATVTAPGLTTLSIERTDISDEGLQALMTAPWFQQLEQLSLSAQRTSPAVRQQVIDAYSGEFLSIYRKDL